MNLDNLSQVVAVVYYCTKGCVNRDLYLFFVLRTLFGGTIRENRQIQKQLIAAYDNLGEAFSEDDVAAIIQPLVRIHRVRLQREYDEAVAMISLFDGEVPRA